MHSKLAALRCYCTTPALPVIVSLTRQAKHSGVQGYSEARLHAGKGPRVFSEAPDPPVSVLPHHALPIHWESQRACIHIIYILKDSR